MHLLSPLEFALNSAIAQDPETQAKLDAFDQYAIAVEVSDFNQRIHILIHDRQLALSLGVDDEANLTLTGDSLALMGLAHDPERLFSPDITIHGDVQFAKQLQDLLEGFDFDWEQQLAKVTGDTLAYPIAHGLRQVGGWVKDRHQSMQMNISEYLKEEARILPDAAEVGPFLSEVDTLRADCDRLEARINRLLGRK